MDGLSATDPFFDDRGVSSTPTDPRVIRAIDLMHERLRSPVRVTELAGEALLSPAHFLRVFTKEVGRTPYRHLTMLRMDEAKRLLERGETVTGVAAHCGYSSTAHFSAAFHKETGVRPSRWAGTSGGSTAPVRR